MARIDSDSVADVRMRLGWESEGARHEEVLTARGLNLWRDLLPAQVHKQLEGLSAGEKIRITADPGQVLPGREDRLAFSLPRKRFDARRPGLEVMPRRGRFYPKGLLSGLPQVFPQNVEPFRCTGVKNGDLVVDFNHPLSGRGLTLDVSVEAVKSEVC
jgi:FKBP-type peptidyl-prolyl cis-trans isomerase 2